jgi:predicted cupin superfamily sugar epimerase
MSICQSFRGSGRSLSDGTAARGRLESGMTTVPDVAAEIIARLKLAPHPEGGWYRETCRQAGPAGGRALSTTILFLLEAGQRSHWHRVDAAETWFWHAGAPLTLRIDDRDIMLGGDVLADQAPHAVVPANSWQAADTTTGWTLVSCTVVPGFEFAGFELAPSGWSFS